MKRTRCVANKRDPYGRATLRCVLIAQQPHEKHLAWNGPHAQEWPNENYQAPPEFQLSDWGRVYETIAIEELKEEVARLRKLMEGKL